MNFNDMKVFVKLFDRGGYVLDFTNNTFKDFFLSHNINIFDEKYNKDSGSKINRLKAFCTIETDNKVGEVLTSLLEYSELVQSVNIDDKTQAQDILNKLMGKVKIVDNEIKESEQDAFLNQEFDNLDLSKLNLDLFKEVIEQRISEIKICLKCNASLSVIFLCGSTLEGILLNLASKNLELFNKANSAPKDKDKDKVRKIQNWTLNDLINVSHELDFIGLDVKKFGHALRDFRNFIHPFQQKALNFMPNKHTAKISWIVLQAAICQISKKTTND